MVGYPKHLNTKKDFLYVKEHFPKEMWIGDFKALLSDMRNWFFEKELSSKEEGIEDDTHKVVEMEDMDKNITYSQYVYQVNPQCRLFKLGFTEEEVQELIK